MNLYTAYKEFCEGTAPQAPTTKRKSGYTQVPGAKLKRLRKNANPQEKQEWEATTKKECNKCEKQLFKSEWDAVEKNAWKQKDRRICATCRPHKAPKRINVTNVICSAS